jgi:hypothetical protein
MLYLPHLHPCCRLEGGLNLVERTIVGASFHESERVAERNLTNDVKSEQLPSANDMSKRHVQGHGLGLYF